MDVYLLALGSEGEGLASHDAIVFDNPHLTKAVVIAPSEKVARQLCATSARHEERRQTADFRAFWLDADKSSCQKLGTAAEGQREGIVCQQT